MSSARRLHPRPLTGRVLCWAVTLGLLQALAGCGGSSVDPAVAVSANDAVSGLPHGVAPTTSAPADEATGGDGPATAPVTGLPSPGAATTTADGWLQPPGVGQGKHRADGAVPPRVSCAGFHDQTGVTDDTVTIATVADRSGPVPGIFTSAQQAVAAYVAYFNATSDLCGRKLRQIALDSRTDAGGDQEMYTKACDQAFAAVGSMSAFDSGGARVAQRCGLPDLRAAAVSDARNACSTCFGVQATDMHAFQNAVPDFFLAHNPAASRHAAMIYVNEAASVQNAKAQQAVEERRGMHFVYSTSFDVAEFNYQPYVQRMKDRGVRWVQFVGSADEAVRLARAMEQARFRPEVFLLDPTAYDPAFARAGSAVEGAIVFLDFVPFEEASRSAELRLYLDWLHRVAPGATPSYFGLFAWSAARLFVEQARALGGGLGRAALVSRLRAVHGWTGNGLHAPQDVGGKANSSCWRFVRLQDGVWRPYGGTSYLCRGSTKVG